MHNSAAVRYVFAITISVTVTVMVFALMWRLVSSDPVQLDNETLVANVEIYQAPPPEQPKPPTTEPPPAELPPAPVMQPTLPKLSVKAPTAPAAIKAAGPPVPSFKFSPSDIQLPSGEGGLFGAGSGAAQGERFVMQGGGSDKLAQKIAAAEAKGTEGYKEVVPFATRQPNVPKAAWDQKIDGWVLVTFSVNSSGRIENIRVLDASPKGLFEASVIEALGGWQYDPADWGGGRTKVQLTQKIQLYWKDYPNNSNQMK
jgi:protein TonB